MYTMEMAIPLDGMARIVAVVRPLHPVHDACIQAAVWRVPSARPASQKPTGYSATMVLQRWLRLTSSRHCLLHISQYHLSFCKPFDLIRFPIAFGLKKPGCMMACINKTKTRGYSQWCDGAHGISSQVTTERALLAQCATMKHAEATNVPSP